MCGRFTLAWDIQHLMERFDLLYTGTADIVPRYNIAPSQNVLAVVNDGQNNRAGWLKWGLIPSWSRDPSAGSGIINAREETVTQKPSFRQAFYRRRCLIPADGFFEWKKDGERKRPFRIRLRDGQPFAMAGLWERWKGKNGETIVSCTILTTRANALMEPIHHRMPVILDPRDEGRWLDRSVTSQAVLQPMLTAYDSRKMEAYEVSSQVNSPKNDTPACIRSLTEE